MINRVEINCLRERGAEFHLSYENYGIFIEHP